MSKSNPHGIKPGQTVWVIQPRFYQKERTLEETTIATVGTKFFTLSHPLAVRTRLLLTTLREEGYRRAFAGWEVYLSKEDYAAAQEHRELVQFIENCIKDWSFWDSISKRLNVEELRTIARVLRSKLPEQADQDLQHG